MNKKYYVITLIAVISLNMVLHAADDKVQLPEQLMICVTGLKEPNDNLHIPITLSDTDSFSGITFGNLFKTNALKHRIPWVIYAVLRQETPIFTFPGESLSAKYTTECHDTLTLLNSQNIDISSDDLASHQTVETLMAKSLATKLNEKPHSRNFQPCTITFNFSIGLLYYDTDGNTTSISPYNAIENVSTPCIDPVISDVSCTLAIARGDYSQLIPLLHTLKHHNNEDGDPSLQYKYNFWLKTFKSLSQATQRDLLLKRVFGITLDLSTTE